MDVAALAIQAAATIAAALAAWAAWQAAKASRDSVRQTEATRRRADLAQEYDRLDRIRQILEEHQLIDDRGSSEAKRLQLAVRLLLRDYDDLPNARAFPPANVSELERGRQALEEVRSTLALINTEIDALS